MKFLRGLFLLLFAVSVLASCADEEEDYVKPSVDIEIEDAPLDRGKGETYP